MIGYAQSVSQMTQSPAIGRQGDAGEIDIKVCKILRWTLWGRRQKHARADPFAFQQTVPFILFSFCRARLTWYIWYVLFIHTARLGQQGCLTYLWSGRIDRTSKTSICSQLIEKGKVFNPTAVQSNKAVYFKNAARN